jgi:hypothetical protein
MRYGINFMSITNYNKASEKTYYIATIFDSHWKIKYFKNWKNKENKNNNTVYIIKMPKKCRLNWLFYFKFRFTHKFDKYRSIYYPVSGILNNSLGKNEDSTKDSLFSVPKQLHNNNRYDELNSYFNSTPKPGIINVLEWWKSYESNYSILAKIAQNYLAILAISVPVEQLFSESSNLITQ